MATRDFIEKNDIKTERIIKYRGKRELFGAQ